MSNWQLAQMNVATMRFARDDARVAGFFERIDEINALADTAEGFVWRLQDDTGNATNIEVEGEPFSVINLSVWESIDALSNYVYRSSHRELIAKRKDWFERPAGVFQGLWWVPEGVRPTAEQGWEKLRLLEEHGPTRDCFTFKVSFPPPD